MKKSFFVLACALLLALSLTAAVGAYEFTPGSEAVVYLNGTAGSDANSGATPESAVATPAKAQSLLPGGGTVVVSGATALTAAYAPDAVNGAVLYTSVYGGTDYRTSGAELSVGGNMAFSNDTYFDNITLSIAKSNLFFAGKFHNFGFGAGVSCKQAVTASGFNYPVILAGVNTPATLAAASSDADFPLTIAGGTWRSFYGGNRRTSVSQVLGKVSGDSYIRIEGGCPAIIGKKLFAQVQRIKAKNKRNTGRYHSKEFYLLTGKLVCDVCGKRMIGNLRFSGRSKTRLATYRCNTHRAMCNNKELNKDYLDAYIAVLIGERLKPKNLRKAVAKVNQQVQKFNSSYDKYHTDVLQQYNEVQDSLANITRAIEKGIFTDDLLQRAEQLENEKAKLETSLHELKLLEPIAYEDVAYLHTQWKELKRNTEEFRTFIQQFVKAIHVRPYDFDIVLDMGFGVVELTETIPMRRGELYEMFDSKVKEQRICLKNQKADT